MFYALQKLLPVRFKPLPDELFTSWLVRLARGNGTKLHTFSSLLFSERRVWSRDLDKSADDRHLDVMIENTGFAPDLISETFLRSFEGKFYERHTPNGNTAWLMPSGIYHQTRRNRGLQMCPACLKEDGESSYYRKFWRVSWVTVCEKHRIILLDRCPGCASPIVFHRGEMGYRSLYSHFSNVKCPSCNLCWTANRTIDAALPAHPDVVRLQKQLKEAVAGGWMKINDRCEAIHSIPFFDGLKQILRLLSVGRKGDRFREAVRLKIGLPPDDTMESFHSFDYLPVESRYRAILSADWLLSDWPKRFVEAATASRTWSSVLLPYNTETPFWYWLPVHDFLTRQTHYTTEAEIFAALEYLKKHYDLLLPSHLENFVGKPYLFEKRSGLFVASIYDKLRKHNERKEKERLKNVAGKAKMISADFSKTKAKRIYRNFKKEHARPACSFKRTQAMLDRLIIIHRRSERLKMVGQMEKTQIATVVAGQFGVTYPVVLKWYRRFKENGIEGLDDQSRSARTFPHQKVFAREEEWIREIHSEGLDSIEIQNELLRRYNFSITEGGLIRVLSRLKLILPNSKKLKNRDKLPRAIPFKAKHRPGRKIHTEQENWILGLHHQGMNNSQIKRELEEQYKLSVGLTTIRDALLRNKLYSPLKKIQKRK